MRKKKTMNKKVNKNWEARMEREGIWEQERPKKNE